jgi:hypothetical protein
MNTTVDNWRVPWALSEGGGLYVAADRRPCAVVRFASGATLCVGADFIEVTAFLLCGPLADVAVPAEALCDGADEVPADAVGVPSVNAAAPTPSATASPPT